MALKVLKTSLNFNLIYIYEPCFRNQTVVVQTKLLGDYFLEL